MKSRMKKLILCLVVCFVLAGSASATPTLVAHYTFDDGTANDTSGSGYHGTLVGSGVTIADGYATFNRYTQGKIDCGFAEATAMCTPVNGVFRDLTVAFFMKTTDGGASSMIVGRSMTTSHYDLAYRVGLDGYGANAGADIPYLGNVWDGPVNDGNWHHVAMVFTDGPAPDGGIRLYVDGVDKGFDDRYSTGRWDNTTDWHLTLGAAADGFWNQYGGSLDDVRIYQGALNQAEITAIIPEPATMMLLGLGGLLLNRRKK